MKWTAFRTWRSSIKEAHAFAELEINQCAPGPFGVWVTTWQRAIHGKMREEYFVAATLREAKKRGEAMATEMLKHAAQALGVA